MLEGHGYVSDDGGGEDSSEDESGQDSDSSFGFILKMAKELKGMKDTATEAERTRFIVQTALRARALRR